MLAVLQLAVQAVPGSRLEISELGRAHTRHPGRHLPHAAPCGLCQAEPII